MRKTKKATPAKKESKEETNQSEALRAELRDLNSLHQKEISKLMEKIRELEKNQKPTERKVPSIDVFNKDGKYVRTYDEDLHGENYKSLAEMFAKKIKGSIK